MNLCFLHPLLPCWGVVVANKYLPELIVTLRDECQTGHVHEIVARLRRRVGSFAREDYNVRDIYIGIASGTDYEHALWRRYDYRKHEKGITEMIAIYRSSSQQSCRDVERQLEKHLAQEYSDRRLNRTGGGGGAPSSQPYHFVYLAVKRLGD